MMIRTNLSESTSIKEQPASLHFKIDSLQASRPSFGTEGHRQHANPDDAVHDQAPVGPGGAEEAIAGGDGRKKGRGGERAGETGKGAWEERRARTSLYARMERQTTAEERGQWAASSTSIPPKQTLLLQASSNCTCPHSPALLVLPGCDAPPTWNS
ncbi:hypothetical protein E2320_011991 [Naja naja]|nr:hypothetical protein E2320_011991 [Naja naja]